MRIVFVDGAWEDYLHWQRTDRRMLEKLNGLIKEASRTPFSGTGKPEPLVGPLRGWWSRRIDREHRLVYRLEGDELRILQCRFHYDD